MTTTHAPSLPGDKNRSRWNGAVPWHPPNPQEHAAAYNTLGVYCQEKKDDQRAEHWFRRACEIWEQDGWPQDPCAGIALDNIINHLLNTGQELAAEEFIKKQLCYEIQ